MTIEVTTASIEPEDTLEPNFRDEAEQELYSTAQKGLAAESFMNKG